MLGLQDPTWESPERASSGSLVFPMGLETPLAQAISKALVAKTQAVPRDMVFGAKTRTHDDSHRNVVSCVFINISDNPTMDSA